VVPQVLCDAGQVVRVLVPFGERGGQLRFAAAERGAGPGVALTSALEATADPAEALANAELVAFAVPAQSLRTNLTAWAPLIPDGALLVSLLKGIELGTCKRMSEVITEVLGADPDRVAVVGGPNLAGEIIRRQFTAAVVACAAPSGALALQGACHTPYFRPYTNTDVTGCELGGTVKNVIAIAVGIAVAMGLGDNTKATLITRGLAEIARLGSALGAQAQTFAGLAGLGDLVATCCSPLSRNRTFGENLGRGMAVAEAAAAMSQTAEGVASSGPVLELARAHGVEMPITEVVEAVMRDGLPVTQAASMLASRSAKPEWYGP
jgi:glycerol-3-phosphate dehydrogenase (NAD(P)+)